MKIAWHDLFTYSFISLPSHPVKLHHGQLLISWRNTPQYRHKHTAKSICSSQHQWLFVFLSVYNRSSNPAIHLSTNCPFHPYTLIVLQKCHSEAKAIDGHEPTEGQLQSISNETVTKWMCALSLYDNGNLGWCVHLNWGAVEKKVSWLLW